MFKNLINKLNSDFSIKSIPLLLICVAINVLGNNLSIALKLPFWLDSIGTAMCACILGPLAGAVTGLAGNLIVSVFYPQQFFYTIISITDGIIAGLLLPKKSFDLFQTFLTAALAAVVGIAFATPLNLIFLGGYTNNIWGDALFDMVQQNGLPATLCAVLGEGFVAIPDKALTMLVAVAAVHSFNKFCGIFRKKEKEDSV